jgi:hypothetical protein
MSWLDVPKEEKNQLRRITRALESRTKVREK